MPIPRFARSCPRLSWTLAGGAPDCYGLLSSPVLLGHDAETRVREWFPLATGQPSYSRDRLTASFFGCPRQVSSRGQRL
jgi:hypothetical protein